jgi:hypothetical protein
MNRPGTFKKGEKKPNQGKRGPDKLGHDARIAIMMVAENLGGVPRMTEWAREDEKNERLFWSSIYPKVLPKEIKAEVAATHVISNLTPEQQKGIAEAILLGK